MVDHDQGGDSSLNSGSSLYLDLGVTKTKNDQLSKSCHHFSLRKYVSEMRKKNGNVCFPFANSDGNNMIRNQLEQKLPPMHVPKFRWWCCEKKSIQESSTGGASTTCSLLETTRFVSNYSHDISPSSSSKNHEIAHPDVPEECDKSDHGRQVDECTTTSYNFGKKTKVGPEVADSNLQDSESTGSDDDIQEITRADYDQARDKKRHQENRDDVQPKSISLVEKCVPRSENQDGCKANSSTAACIRKGFDSTNVELRNVFPNCKAPPGSKESATTSFHSQLVRHPSARGNPSSKNEGNNLARNNHHDDSSRGVYPRRKTRKMRLVADLLGGNANLENNHLRTDGNYSPNSDSISSLPSTILASTSVREANAKIDDNIGNVPRRKRKMSNDQERKYMDHINAQNSGEVVKSSKEDADNRTKATEISDSKWDQENVDGAVVYHRCKRQRSGRERSSFVRRKSMPSAQNGDEKLCSKPWPEVTRQNSHTTLGSDGSNTVTEWISDEIMEIVEFMAKMQHERRCSDFSSPEAAAGSEQHMISGEDLQSRRKIRSCEKSFSENSNGRKKPRVTKTSPADGRVQ